LWEAANRSIGMKLSEVIEGLYSYDIDKNIETINLSIWAKDYPFDVNNCSIIHTGFLFEMQNEKEMELFYDFVNNKLIRQPKFNDNPVVLGLVYFFWNDWIKVWDYKMVVSVDEIKDELIVSSFEKAEEVFDYKDFQIISSENTEPINLTELRKDFEKRLWFDGEKFEEINEDED
jgi:hypothetical protein